MWTIILGLGRLIPVKDWIYLFLIAALGIGVLTVRSHWINLGRSEAVADITAANQKANDNAGKGIKDVTACYDAGGTWNRDRGVCDPAAANN